MDKIGIGLVTCSIRGSLKNLIEKLDELADRDDMVFVLADDSCGRDGVTEYIKDLLDKSKIDWIYKEAGMAQVAHTKNVLLEEFLKDEEIKHMFLIEDDILIKDISVFDKYVELSEETNIKHLLYYEKYPKYILGNVGAITVRFNQDCDGGFNYFRRELIEKIGLLDTGYINACEHIDHTYRAYLSGMFGPMWYFPDHPESDSLLGYEPVESHINNTSDHKKNVEISFKHFYDKYNFPFFQVPLVSPEEALAFYNRNA